MYIQVTSTSNSQSDSENKIRAKMLLENVLSFFASGVAAQITSEKVRQIL